MQEQALRDGAFQSTPSAWREWIEITPGSTNKDVTDGLPPCGGSGLKYRSYAY